MLGSEIILSSNPQGKFDEGTITGTPKPGTVVQLDISEPPSGGRFSYEVANMDGDGGVAASAILNADPLQGKTYADAYVSGSRCFVYYPVVGEEFNMLVGQGSGTGNTITQGDKLMVDDGTGVLVALSGNPAGLIFQAMETIEDTAEPILCWVRLLNN